MRARVGGVDPNLGEDRGITLVELLVTAAITAVLGVIATTVTLATFGTQKTRLVNSNRTAESKVATELLSRDLRDARLIPSWTNKNNATMSWVKVWDDRNLDYVRQPAEMVTWAVDSSGRLCRTTDASETRCVTGGTTGKVEFSFFYVAPDPALSPDKRKYSSVTVTLQAEGDSVPRERKVLPRVWTVALENFRSGEP